MIAIKLVLNSVILWSVELPEKLNNVVSSKPSSLLSSRISSRLDKRPCLRAPPKFVTTVWFRMRALFRLNIRSFSEVPTNIWLSLRVSLLLSRISSCNAGNLAWENQRAWISIIELLVRSKVLRLERMFGSWTFLRYLVFDPVIVSAVVPDGICLIRGLGHLLHVRLVPEQWQYEIDTVNEQGVSWAILAVAEKAITTRVKNKAVFK